MRAQSAAGIGADGLAGPATIASLRGRGTATKRHRPERAGQLPAAGRRGRSAMASAPPAAAVVSTRGSTSRSPRGPRSKPPGVGTTIFAGYNAGGYGNLVVVQHRLGYTTWYAHLSSITTWVGEQVEGGTRLGYVGSTGYSTGPHLHFEVRRYDTPIDPIPMLLTASPRGRSASPAAAPRARVRRRARFR